MDGKEECWEDSIQMEDDVIICPLETYDCEEAKERASLLWLLSKAFDGVIPDDLKEPFYRDHAEQRRLKPKVIHSLANAELYCLALANIYSDPNYNNLDHHGVIQALTRKGISLLETAEMPLTETVLVQTAPLKLSAHLAVIDGMISLYVKEVLIPEKIVDTIRCFAHVNLTSEMPSNPEEAAILWVNKCCSTLELEIKKEYRSEESLDKLPRIPVLQELSDIKDGCSLAAVICFYCPNHLSWENVCWNKPMSLGDSIYNLQLVKQFCHTNLPRQIDFLTLEDLLYTHHSIKDNILVFVAELLFSFVIWPASCVSRPVPQEPQEASHDNKSRSNSIPSHKAHLSAIPNLRADSYGGSSSSLPELRPGCGSQSGREASGKSGSKKFTSSERIRMSPRLQRTSSSGVVNGFKSSNTSLDGGNTDQRLSNSGNVRRDASYLSMPADDTFSGPDGTQPSDNQSAGLEVYYHRLSATEGPVRSGSLTNVRENSWAKSGNARPSLKSSSSSQSSGICVSETDKHPVKTSFAKLSQDPEAKSHGINIVYMQRERENTKCKSAKPGSSKDKHATFAALPNTTTWQQQRVLSSNSSQADSGHETPIEQTDPSLNIQLANLRMKLEDKRRKIEMEKKRREAIWKREWQKVGKVAFLQAVSRSCAAEVGTPDSGTGKEDDYAELSVAYRPLEIPTSSPSMVRRMSIQEIAEDLDSIQKKWLQGGEADAVEQALVDAPDSQITSDFEASIEQLNSSLCDLQADISRITIQQEHVENLLQDSVEDASHFFLHGEPSTSQVQQSPMKTWSKAPLSSYTGHPVSAHLFHSDLSPQRQPYHGQSLIERQISQDESALPASPSEKFQTANVEDLYSKVIKPSNRQKVKALNHSSSLPSEPVVKKDVRQYQQGFGSPSRTANQARLQTASPHHERTVASTASPQKRPSGTDQRFYISFNDQPTKMTTRWQRADGNATPTPTLPSKPPPDGSNSFGFVIGADLVHPDPETEVEMAKKKEMIMNLSIRRRADHENQRLIKEQEYARLREEEQRKREYTEKKREEEKQRRQAILEQYRQRKLQEELLEKEGLKDAPAPPSRSQTGVTKSRSSILPSKKTDNRICSDFTKPIAELRTQVAPYNRSTAKPRPKSSFISSTVPDSGLYNVDSCVANKRNSQFIPTVKDGQDFDIDSLNSTGTSVSSRDQTQSPRNGQVPSSHCSGDGVLRPPESGGKSSDGASDTTSNSSNAAMMIEYTGPKLFVKPAAKSNRGIIINAINTVLAGSVNSDTKKKVLDEINRSESKHFLILFRDAGCQFRAIYSYNPDTDEVIKLYGTGPKVVFEKVMEKFYKYNSGGKCFSEVQTKHLTVTIDAFTIPNSMWAGKRVVAPRKEFF